MRAVILAAGQGLRLRPLTNDRPKCMVEVHGRTLLEGILEAAQEVGTEQAVLVTGHFGDALRARFGASFRGMAMSYVHNEVFATTNNLYSLWLARAYLDQDLLLFESDLCLSQPIVTDVARSMGDLVAVVDNFRPPMNGTVIVREGEAYRMVLKSGQGPSFDYASALKTVNLYRMSGAMLRERYAAALDAAVRSARTDLYYEAVLAELVERKEISLSVTHVGTHPWAEIDTIDDLRDAERLNPAGRAGASKCES